MTIKAQVDPVDASKRVLLACPECGSDQYLVARRSITFDAWQNVHAYLYGDGERKPEDRASPEYGDIEQVVTTWYLCTSPDCEESGERTAERTLEELIVFPRPMDLCRRCGHHYSEHADWSRSAFDPHDERPCRVCGCEDFEVRIVAKDQAQLPGVTVEAVRESGHDGESVTAMAGGAA